MSRIQKPLGYDPFSASPCTPGPTGCNDASDPRTPNWFIGDTPSPLGHGGDYATPKKANEPKFIWSNLTLFASNSPDLPQSVQSPISTHLPDIVEGPAFISIDAHPSAPAFYEWFPLEPILPSSRFKVKSTVKLRDISIRSLLDAILENQAKDVLIVCHGHGGGLSVPLVAGSKEPLGIKALDVFAGKMEESNLGLKRSALDALKKQVRQMQKLGLRLVVIRGCTVGTYLDVLEKLKDFFKCQVVCAPDTLDGHGWAAVKRIPMEKWQFEHPAAVVEFEAPNRFAWTDSGNNLISAANAESDKAIDDWVKKHLPGAARHVGTSFPYHGFTVSDRVTFPGDPEFRKRLQRTN